MHYINDPKTTAKTYQECIDAAIANGVEPKRVYIFLAGLGVRGEPTRVMDESFNGYQAPVKMAITGANTLIKTIKVCKDCEQLVLK